MTTQAHTYKQDEALQVPNTLPANGGVSDAEVEAAYRLLSEVIHIDCGLSYVQAVVRRTLEDFAQSRQPSAQGGEATALDKNHLPDLRYIRMFLLGLSDEKHRSGDLNAAITGINYIIKRSEEAPPAGGGKEALSDAERTEIPNYTIKVDVGGGAAMFIPNPVTDPHIGYSLRYSGNLNATRAGRFSAAALIESYDYIVSDESSLKEVARRLSLMRKARRAAIRAGKKG